MSTDLDAEDRDRIDRLSARVEDLEAALEGDAGTPAQKATIVATKGTMDMAFPPLNLASTAAAFGWDVKVFHTFYGLDILHTERSKRLPMSSVGNPHLPVPNLIAVLPGMDAMSARMMERRMRDNGNAMIEELVELCLNHDVELMACGTTIDLMGYEEDDFYEGVTVGVGSPTAFQEMATSEIQLII